MTNFDKQRFEAQTHGVALSDIRAVLCKFHAILSVVAGQLPADDPYHKLADDMKSLIDSMPSTGSERDYLSYLGKDGTLKIGGASLPNLLNQGDIDCIKRLSLI